MKKILICLEPGDAKLSLELLAVAERLFDEPCRYEALCIDGDAADVAGALEVVYRVAGEGIEPWNQLAITNLVQALHKMNDFDAILLLSTHWGRMQGPRIAMRLETGLVADITDLGRKDEHLMMIRPTFGGRIMAGIVNAETRPLMMTVRPGVFDWQGEATRETNVVDVDFSDSKPSQVKRVSRRKKPVDTDIRQAERLVSAGAGACRDLEGLADVAKILGAETSASRGIVDKGLADRSIQVGQSGKIVHPRLYLAAGIRGAIQHVAGLRDVEHLVVVNTDPGAPICSLADVVIEGSVAEFVDLFKKFTD